MWCYATRLARSTRVDTPHTRGVQYSRLHCVRGREFLLEAAAVYLSGCRSTERERQQPTEHCTCTLHRSEHRRDTVSSVLAPAVRPHRRVSACLGMCLRIPRHVVNRKGWTNCWTACNRVRAIGWSLRFPEGTRQRTCQTRRVRGAKELTVRDEVSGAGQPATRRLPHRPRDNLPHRPSTSPEGRQSCLAASHAPAVGGARQEGGRLPKSMMTAMRVAPLRPSAVSGP